jgi:hypothetical protein
MPPGSRTNFLPGWTWREDVPVQAPTKQRARSIFFRLAAVFEDHMILAVVLVQILRLARFSYLPDAPVIDHPVEWCRVAVSADLDRLQLAPDIELRARQV